MLLAREAGYSRLTSSIQAPGTSGKTWKVSLNTHAGTRTGASCFGLEAIWLVPARQLSLPLGLVSREIVALAGGLE